MEYTRNSDLVEMGIDEFAKDTPETPKEETEEKPKKTRKKKED